MSTPFSAIVPLATAMQLVSPSSPAPAGRFQGDPLRWIGVPARTVLSAFATGAVTAVSQGSSNGIPGDGSAAWTLFEISPLPQRAASVFMTVPGGLPVQLILVTGNVSGPNQDDSITASSAVITAPAGAGNTAFFAIAFQDRLCRDPLSWAVALGGGGDATWAPFQTAIAALPMANQLFLLDQLGQPLENGVVSIAIGGGTPSSVTFSKGSDGASGIAVPAASTAAITFTSAQAPIVSAVGADAGAFNAPFTLTSGAHLAQLLDASSWFAVRDASVIGLAQWNPNSNVEPIVDGNPYFARLVTDLRAAKPTGAVELAGWAFVKGSLADNTIDWPLIPEQDQSPNDTRLVSLATELATAGVSVRFLVNQFLQFDSSGLDDFAPPLSMVLLSVLVALAPLQALAKLVTDPAGYAALIITTALEGTILSTSLSQSILKDYFEFSQTAVQALNAITFSGPTGQLTSGMAVWTPYPAAFADNPLLTLPLQILGITIDDISHMGVYHQKFISIQQPDGSLVSYLGGIDINSDRVDTPLHRALHPFHDVQLRITGPAIRDIVQTFNDRATFHQTTGTITPPATIPAAGSHLVQIARTYFKPSPAGTKPFPFAPNGEATTINTIKTAIGAAREFIYIEDQYFTPPDDYVQALIDAGASQRGLKFLMITVPYQTDQPYGSIRRGDVVSALTNAWGPRFMIGSPFRRFLHPTPALTMNLGRMWLVNPIGDTDINGVFAPQAHLPAPPFWCFIGNELVFVIATGAAGTTGSPPVLTQGVQFVRGGPALPAGGWGSNPVPHPAGTPVLCVQVPEIYVHAKVMIIDDIFLFSGSSNINRRGLYHDGEINAFTVSQHLKSDPQNPARILRCRLWAEHLGLAPEIGLSLFWDPLSAQAYFQSRSWFTGRRWQNFNFFFGSSPPVESIGVSSSIFGELLDVAAASVNQLALRPELWPSFADPTTNLEPGPLKPGPDYP